VTVSSEGVPGLIGGGALVILVINGKVHRGGETQRTRVHDRSASAGSSAASTRGRRSPSDGGSIVDIIRRFATGKGAGMV
jgi:hypothetical protein